MKTYIYPQNLNAAANIWLWSMKDGVISLIAVMFAAVIGVTTGWLLPLAAVMVYAFITIRLEDITIKDCLGNMFRFLFGQRTFFWR